jgi:hypothetical protein
MIVQSPTVEDHASVRGGWQVNPESCCANWLSRMWRRDGGSLMEKALTSTEISMAFIPPSRNDEE